MTTNDLSLLPRAKWHLLRRVAAATPSNSLLVTWVNGLIDRNPLTPSNMGRLRWVSGNGLSFGSRHIPANGTVSLTAIYDAQSPSADPDDIVVQAMVEDTVNGGTITSCATTMVVRVDMMIRHKAPKNGCDYRHQYGIGEDVIFHQFPSEPSMTLDLKDATVTGSGAARMIHWGVSNVVHTLKIRAGTTEYLPQISVVCPQRVEGCNARAYTSGFDPGVAGGLELWQSYRIHPLTVSFEGLQIEEVPCDEEIPPQGYFAFTPTNIFLRSHTRKAGAGKWVEVFDGNWLGGEGSCDKAGYLGNLPRMMPDGTPTTNTAFGWLGGSLTWKVPFGWNKNLKTGSMADPVGRFAENTTQVFHVNEDGDFSVEKLGHKAERKITGEVSVSNINNHE